MFWQLNCLGHQHQHHHAPCTVFDVVVIAVMALELLELLEARVAPLTLSGVVVSCSGKKRNGTHANHYFHSAAAAVVVPSAAGRKSTGASGVGWLMPRSSQKQKRRVLVRKSSTDSLLALGPVAEGAALAAGSRTGVSE